MKAVIWSKPACPYCDKSKALMKAKGIEYEEKNIADGHKIQDLLELVPNAICIVIVGVVRPYIKATNIQVIHHLPPFPLA